MKKKQSLKQGEKILFIIFGVFIVFAVIGYIALEVYRTNLDRPMYKTRVHYNFSEEGKLGSQLFRHSRCTSCHRALGNGTNMGNDLDGTGSKRTLAWLLNFLKNPESTYSLRTLDHGLAPKEAAYVAKLPEKDRHAIAVFLSELKVEQGSSMSPLPPEGRSQFIDDMLDAWAPASWKDKYTDIRDTDKFIKSPEGEK